MTFDDEGNVYIADLDHGKVLKWTPEGALLTLAELPGKGNAHNVYANGALYVNKIWDHVIYRVELDSGAYGIVAGNGKAGYTDGLTGVATVEEPNGIATNNARDVVYFNTHRGLMFKNAWTGCFAAAAIGRIDQVSRRSPQFRLNTIKDGAKVHFLIQKQLRASLIGGALPRPPARLSAQTTPVPFRPLAKCPLNVSLPPQGKIGLGRRCKFALSRARVICAAAGWRNEWASMTIMTPLLLAPVIMD